MTHICQRVSTRKIAPGDPHRRIILAADSTYRSGRCPVWIKVRNPASAAVQRERSEDWNR
jgi:hypothetical protein